MEETLMQQRRVREEGFRIVNLSVRLPIVDLVGRYLTNYLIGREPTSQRLIFDPCTMRYRGLMRY